jgi:hypothetical protein
LGVHALYATLSPLSWLFQGRVYLYGFSSPRLYLLQPTTDDVAQLLNIALAYTAGFASVYLLLRRQVPQAVPNAYVRISSAKMGAALAIGVVFQAITLILAGTNFIRSSESYVDSFLRIQQLPLAVRQALKLGYGISSFATLVFLIGILQRWPRNRLWFIFYFAFVLLSFDPEGSRSPVVIGLLSVALLWHVLIRPISARRWLIGGAVGLLLFLVLGLRRDVRSFAALGPLGSDAVGISLGEFDSLWGNAVEVLQARDSAGFQVPIAARFAELWAFVPSQLLPFEKLDLAGWFLETFHPAYKAVGGGLAFGAISQAAIGGGFLEAALRGTLLGAMAAWLMKWYRTPSKVWWHLPVHMYLLVFVFQSARDTTFRQLTDLLQLVLPAILLIALIASILVRRSDASRLVGAPCRRSSI